MTTTDTPRTDLKELELREVQYPHDFYALGDLCRELEREITSWKAKAHEAEDQEGKLEADVERMKDELKKGAFVLSTIVTALEDAVPWIRETLNRD